MQRPWHKHATWHLWFEACNVTFVVWVPHAIHCIQNVHRNAERSHPLSRLERKSRSAKSPDMLSLTISVFIEESRGCWWSLCLLVVMSRPRLPRWSQGETLGYLHICDFSSDSRESRLHVDTAAMASADEILWQGLDPTAQKHAFYSGIWDTKDQWWHVRWFEYVVQQ